MAGILWGSYFPGFNGIVGFALSISAGVGIAILFRKKEVGILPFLMALAMGYLAIGCWIDPRYSPDDIIHFGNRYSLRIAGRIHTDPQPYGSDGIRFVLRAESLGREEIPVTGLVRVSARAEIPDLSVGDRIAFAGKIRAIRNFGNPGGFDYERHMAFQGIRVSAYARKGSLILLEEFEGSDLRIIVGNLRKDLARMIETTGEHGLSAGVMKALIIGEKGDITADLRDRFNRAGVSHLLAISGLHVGIVATLFFGVFRRLLAWWRHLLWKGWLNRAASVLTLVPVLGYGLISGMSPATQRAILMVAVFLAAFWVKREPDILNTLAVAALLILAVHPPALFSVSFQLSFVAVIAIARGMARSVRPFPEASNRLSLWTLRLKNLVRVSFWAIIGTLPLCMFYFNQVSFIGLIANLVFIPMIGFGSVPLGLTGVFLFPISPEAAESAFFLAHRVTDFALKLLPCFSELPFGSFRTVTPSILEISIYYLWVWLIVTWKYRSEHPMKGFRAVHPRLILMVGLLVSAADIAYWIDQRFGRDDLRVTVMDVGQGSAILAELPGGECILIDGGGFYDNAVFDVGAQIVAPILWRKKIRTVETIILTHPDSDHLNGLLFIAEHFHVRSVWTSGVGKDTAAYREFMEIVRRQNIERPDFQSMPRQAGPGALDLKILYPPPNFLDQENAAAWRRESNNASLVTMLRFGEVAFLFPGDIEAEAEAELVQLRGDELNCTVLIAPHHGCRTSSSPVFVDHAAPEIVITSSGWENRFQCPHPSVLERYAERGCRIFGTDRHGAVEVCTNGREIRIETGSGHRFREFIGRD